MIDLFTAATPNGHKISIALEELKLPYKLHVFDLGNGDQKASEFLKISPNARIPAIVDRLNNDFSVFESGAVLIYLAEKTGQLLPSDDNARSQVLQWLMFQMSGVGPMMGQLFVFQNYFPEKIPSVIQRYQAETMRLFEVTDKQLQISEYISNEYSIADIALWPWIRLYDKLDLDITQLPNLMRWLDLIGDREEAQRGIERPPMLDDAQRQKTAQSILTK